MKATLSQTKKTIQLLAGALIILTVATSAQERKPIVEGYPSDVLASLEVRDRARRNTPREMAGYSVQYVFTVINKWKGPNGLPPTVTVAFKGGDSALRQQIAEAATEWSKYAQITFDFKDPSTGGFR